MTSFTVNGQPVHYRMDPATPLLWALRDASNLTGTKYGCGTGHCGACTVHVDGRAVRSCQVPIGRLEGSFDMNGARAAMAPFMSTGGRYAAARCRSAVWKAASSPR